MATTFILVVSVLVYVAEGAYKVSPFQKLSFRNVETNVVGNVQSTTSVLYCSQLCALNLNCITLSYYHVQKLCTMYSRMVTNIDFVPSAKDIYFYGKRVNGNWGSWSTYSPCSLSCGGGIQTRSRSCDNPSPSYGGSICAGTPTENSDCNTAACPVNGNWGTWSSYNQCSVTCGGGTQTRSRSCDSPAPSNGGSNCPGSTTETQACNPSLCPVDGNWGDWSAYGQCTVTCGGGTQSRTRQCNNPSPSNGGAACVGSDTDNTACNASPCPAVVNGNWGTWSAYNQCSVTCGGGTQTRSRSCDSPAPSNGGSNCPGSTTESQACNPSLCPVNGNWGTWSSYNQCSVTCGGGTQTRSRSCDNPAPSNGGSGCPGSTTESQACNPSLCPVAGNWGDWSAYGQCTVTCGGGTKSRTRLCNNPSPSNGGAACVGSDTDNSACNASPCPDAVCYSKSGYDFDDNTRTCIKISSSSANFDNAKTACQSEGGTLFKMDSVGKRNVLDTLVKSQGMNSGGIFIGAKDVGTLEYKWLDGTPVNWIGNPPTTHNQDCVRYDIASQEMDETYCTNNLKYVCEQSV